MIAQKREGRMIAEIMKMPRLWSAARYGAALAIVARTSGIASAQTYGFATLPPGTLNHTTATAISKVLKEKAGLNVLVQPTAGDQVIVPMVGRAEAELGISNVMEVADGI